MPARALLLRLTLASRGLAHNAPLADQHDVLARELFLKLSDEAGLNLVHDFQQLEGHKNDHGLAAGHVYLCSKEA